MIQHTINGGAARRQEIVNPSAGLSRVVLAAILGGFPVTAQAQPMPLWAVAAVLSPLLVLVLCVMLGWLTRSLRIGALHAVLILAWVMLFTLTSYFVKNDYVIWTPLALYVLHTVLLLVLIVVQIARRIHDSSHTI